MKKLVTILLVTSLVLGSCDSADDMVPEGDIEIGAVLPLTGTLTRTGAEMRRAIEMARDQVNAMNLIPNGEIRLTVEDNQSSADGTEAAFRKLVGEENVVAIIGPYTSTSTQRIIPIIDEAGIVTLAPASAAKGLSAMSEYLFRTSLTVDKLVPEGVKTTHETLGYSSAALLTNESDTFSRSARDRVKEELGKLGGVSIVVEETFQRTPGTGAPDVSGELTAILNASPRPEVLFFSGLSPDRVNIVTTARSVGITDIPIITTLLSVDDVRVINEEMPGAAEGVISFVVWVSSSTHPASVAFVKEYEERYLETPGDFAARAYAGAALLFKGVTDALPDRTSNAIRDALATLSNEDTIYGMFSFDEYGDPVYSPTVVVVQGSGFVLFE